MKEIKSAEACQTADVHFVELKSTFIKEKQNLIIRKNGIEIEIPRNSNKVDSEELKAEYWDETRYRKKADDLEEECRKNCYMWVVLGGT